MLIQQRNFECENDDVYDRLSCSINDVTFRLLLNWATVMMQSKFLITLSLLILGFTAAGCTSAAITGTTIAVKASQRGKLLPLAQQGDPKAQTDLGLSHCCAGVGFSTQTATEWLCKAAHQDYARAQFELGRIYAGGVARTPTPGQMITSSVTAKKNYGLSTMWYKLAAQNGYQPAKRRLRTVEADIASGKLPNTAETVSSRLIDNWKAQPCTYSQVFGA